MARRDRTAMSTAAIWRCALGRSASSGGRSRTPSSVQDPGTKPPGGCPPAVRVAWVGFSAMTTLAQLQAADPAYETVKVVSVKRGTEVYSVLTVGGTAGSGFFLPVNGPEPRVNDEITSWDAGGWQRGMVLTNHVTGAEHVYFYRTVEQQEAWFQAEAERIRARGEKTL